ncbi:hypothetical protein E5288_WYG020565 [Bos mutus]|uniref:Methyl-CpG binding protein 2/3 C-terminal domain-containing protein n=1 Tax=Bos mutus TaxID=72004 RepID=A0A6B0RP49_9CETA|nr:hypothetical protein [Bos mutus]
MEIQNNLVILQEIFKICVLYPYGEESRIVLLDEDIRKQEERVQQVRKKLEEALMADILSRAADAEAVDLEVDSGDDA